MKLQDFLKCKKVRCVKGCGGHLTVGETYHVLGLSVPNNLVQVENDNGFITEYDFGSFEPVLDSAENPLQDMELTPKFKAVEPVLVDNSINIHDVGTDILDTNADIKDTPKFQVRDKVYAPSVGSKIYTLKDVGGDWCYPLRIHCNHDDDYEFTKEGLITAEGLPVLFLATELNHSLLSQLYPNIDFEQPHKELKGSDLCFEKLRNSKKLVICAVSDLSDEMAIKRLQDGDACIRVIKDRNPTPYHFIDTYGIRHGFAVPLNDETGEPLTQAVLDE